jgi:hypothetical protein
MNEKISTNGVVISGKEITTEDAPVSFGMPHVTLEQAKEIAAAQPFPKVTEDSIKSRIKIITYYEHIMTTGGRLTICIIEMQNGFVVHGVSAAADPRNHNPAVGIRYAYENAFKGLWQLEGYLLRQGLYEQGYNEKAKEF